MNIVSIVQSVNEWFNNSYLNIQTEWSRIQFDKKEQIRLLVSLERLTRYKSLSDAISHMIETSEGIVVDVLLDMQQSAKEGNAYMSKAEKWFPLDIAASLKLGETKNINYTLKTSAELMQGVSGNVFSSFTLLIYPMVILTSVFALCSFVDHKILKLLEAKINKLSEVPQDIVIVKIGSSFVGFAGILTAIVFFSLFVFFKIQLSNHVGKNRFKLEKMPIFSEFRQLTAIRFLKMYSNLLKQGLVNYDILMTIYEASNSKYLQYHIEKIIPIIQRGGKITQAFNTGLIDRRDLATMKVLFGTQGDGYQEAVDVACLEATDRLSRKMTRISYFLVIFIGGVGAFFGLPAISVIMSIDQFYS